MPESNQDNFKVNALISIMVLLIIGIIIGVFSERSYKGPVKIEPPHKDVKDEIIKIEKEELDTIVVIADSTFIDALRELRK